MAHPHDREPRQGGPMDPAGEGKTAGSNTQSQGGISHEVAESARRERSASAGVTDMDRVDPNGLSLDEGGGEYPQDGRAHHGFTGDNADHQPDDSSGVGVNPQPGPVADLGPQQDTRTHGVPEDRAERTTGGDSPNPQAMGGSPGGPRNAPERIPGQDADDGMIGGPSGGNSQRDPQV